jgi:hypothetical protein
MRSKERQEAALETWGAKVAGAALDVPTVIGIPDHFTLVIPTDALHVCRTTWRAEMRIGVAFE